MSDDNILKFRGGEEAPLSVEDALASVVDCDKVIVIGHKDGRLRLVASGDETVTWVVAQFEIVKHYLISMMGGMD